MIFFFLIFDGEVMVFNVVKKKCGLKIMLLFKIYFELMVINVNCIFKMVKYMFLKFIFWFLGDVSNFENEMKLNVMWNSSLIGKK